MNTPLSRRQWLAGATAGTLAAAGAPAVARAAADKPAENAFTFCFNTSTIMGQKLSLVEEVEIAARAGYQAIEPWVPKMEAFAKEGGSLKDVGKRIRDHGMFVPDVIGFFEWVVDDDARRKKGLEYARRCMDLARQIGSQRIAAPPVGYTDRGGLDLLRAAERYRALLEIGDRVGVVPQVEVWGFSRSLNRLGEAALVALESGHPRACVLADVYHLHKGGSGFATLKLLSGSALQVFHLNDYPADPPPAAITDAHRVYPGDGVAPLKEALRDLRQAGFRGVLSLELFNREYWKQDPLQVARTGLEKMRAVARAAV